MTSVGRIKVVSATGRAQSVQCELCSAFGEARSRGSEAKWFRPPSGWAILLGSAEPRLMCGLCSDRVGL